jgi:hypothetical protein
MVTAGSIIRFAGETCWTAGGLDNCNIPSIDGGIGFSIGKKPYYVKRNKKIYLFNTSIEADEFLEAEKIALEAIEKAQKTSKRAKKRFKDKVYPAADSIDLIEIERLSIQFDIQYVIPQLFQEQDYFELVRIAYIIKQMQDEDDIEILLMACI